VHVNIWCRPGNL